MNTEIRKFYDLIPPQSNYEVEQLPGIDELLKKWSEIAIDYQMEDRDDDGCLMEAEYTLREDQLKMLLKQYAASLQSQNEQLRKALEAQGMYLSFLTHHYRALFEFARVHGYEANEKDVRQGEALRNQMSITQQALTPQQ